MSTKTRDYFNEHPIYTLSDIAKSLQSVIAKTYRQPYYIKAEIIKLNYYRIAVIATLNWLKRE